jgi:uncharacterized RDD family membrane protein YckC
MSSLDTGFPAERPATVTSARAGFWRRFAGSFVDAILLGVVSTILRLILNDVGVGLTFIVDFGYFTYFHGSTGQTPGDAALSIRVVDKQGGGPIGYPRAFVRCLVSIVSGLVFGLGYFWMLWDPEKQTWLDHAATSLVIPADR